MNFEQEKRGAVVFVTMPGESFEAAMVPDFKHNIAPVVEENTRVVFDLSNIRFLDSMGCGALLTCHRKLKEKNGNLVKKNWIMVTIWLTLQRPCWIPSLRNIRTRCRIY